MSGRDFPKIVIPTLNGEETVVGVHSSGIQLEEGVNTSGGRYYCSNCKRKIHCYVTIDRETHEAKVHNTCKDKICECKCRTHYACKICGYLHPYGTKCDRPLEERTTTLKDDKAWEELLASFKVKDKKKDKKKKK